MQTNGTNTILHILNEIHLVQHYGTTNSKNGSTLKRDIVQDIGTLLTGKKWPITQYFLVYGAASAWTLRFRLSVKKRTVYNALESLKQCGLIAEFHKAPKANERGQEASIWGLITAPDNQITDATVLHMRLCSKKYQTAERVGQTILEDYMSKQLKEIAYRDILQEVKKLKIPFKTPDIAELTATFLHEQGLKVWR